MTNLSGKNRELLNSFYDFGLSNYLKVQQSTDGTKKYLFNAGPNMFIETAMIPDSDRKTVCVSCQMGCKMGCVFCMTGRQGFQSNLTSGQILNQFRSIDEHGQITNIVYMGMGEPFDNITEVLKSLEILTANWGYALSPKRITVSTIGILPGITQFLQKSNCHLAISLHNPFAEQRAQLMPVEKKYNITHVIKLLKQFDFGLQRRLSFEYIMFKDVNDTPEHVKGLVKLLHGLRCRVNLIKFHAIPGATLSGSTDSTMQQFKDALNANGILTTIRASRGQDIYAACGLLSTKELVQKNGTKNN